MKYGTEQTLRVTVEHTGRTRASGVHAGDLTYRVIYADGRSMIPAPTGRELKALGLSVPTPPEPEGIAFATPVRQSHFSWRTARKAVGTARWYPVNHPQEATADPYLTWEQLNEQHGPLTVYTAEEAK